MLHISCIFINPSAVLGLSCLLRVFRFHTIVKLFVIPIGICTFHSSALSFPGAKSLRIDLLACVCLYLCDCLHPAFGCQFTIKCYVVIVRAVVVNLHISATLTAVLPVKNFIHARGLLHAKLRLISYRYLINTFAPACTALPADQLLKFSERW